jgi:hypothetical protein
MTEHYHLAQLNVGVLRAPLNRPELADFVAQLEPVNALADAAPGFVWRLQTDAGDATDIRPFDDEMIAINCSVWESLEALWNFTYRSAHLDVMRHRREWFQRMVEPYLVLWWVPAGHIPTIDEALARLAQLRAQGPGPAAFTFKEPHPRPGSATAATAAGDSYAGG